MKTITVEDVLASYPYPDYSTTEKLKPLFREQKSLSASCILKLKIPNQDKIWFLSRDCFITNKQMALFTIFCAEQLINLSVPQIDLLKKTVIVAKNFLENPTADNEKDFAYVPYYVNYVCSAYPSASREEQIVYLVQLIGE